MLPLGGWNRRGVRVGRVGLKSLGTCSAVGE